jgi:hypothetical protein
MSGSVAFRYSSDTNEATNVTITIPPFFGSFSRTSSGTLRTWSQRARAEEWEKMTGASATLSASSIVAGVTCERSTSIPSRFISRTTSSPNRVSPPCISTSPAASAQSSVFVWVSVM